MRRTTGAKLALAYSRQVAGSPLPTAAAHLEAAKLLAGLVDELRHGGWRRRTLQLGRQEALSINHWRLERRLGIGGGGGRLLLRQGRCQPGRRCGAAGLLAG